MNDMEKKVNANSGIGFGGLLCITLIVLKLCHVITWSWVWVLAPAWIELILVVIIGITLYFIYGRK